MPVNKEVERVETARIKRAVFDMRQNAVSYRDIASDLGISVNTARAYYVETRAVLVPTEEVEEIRDRDIDGYDKSERLCLHSIELVTKQLDKDMSEGLPLNDRRISLLKDLNSQLIEIRKARALLVGANKPVTVNHKLTVRTEFDETIEELTSILLGGGTVLSLPDDVLVEE